MYFDLDEYKQNSVVYVNKKSICTIEIVNVDRKHSTFSFERNIFLYSYITQIEASV